MYRNGKPIQAKPRERIQEEVGIEVQWTMMKIVLYALLTNAEHALYETCLRMLVRMNTKLTDLMDKSTQSDMKYTDKKESVFSIPFSLLSCSWQKSKQCSA